MRAFVDFKTRLEKQFKRERREILKFRSDNGGEFNGDFQGYLNRQGIKHELSVEYCHPQNGTAERTIETLVGKTRSLMFESCMPEQYWPLAVKTFLYNLSSHAALDEKSPFKVMFPNQKEHIESGKHLYVFGSAAFRWLHHERRTRLRFSTSEPTSEKMVFVGYSPNADAYLLLNP